MNAKACKAPRREIKQQYPNADKSVKKRLFKEGCRQFKFLTAKEKGEDVIEIKNKG